MRPPERQPRKFKFSHKALENLPTTPQGSPSSCIEFSDTTVPGLRIAVYKSGLRVFRHRFVFRGVKKLMTLGEFPGVSLDRARERVRLNKGLLSEDVNPLEEREKIRQAPTFEQFVEDTYLPFAQTERRSLRDIKSRLKGRLLPIFGKKQLPQILKRDVVDFHQRERREVSAATANRSLSLFSSVMNLALYAELISVNPAQGVRKHKENESRSRFLVGDELGRFLKALRVEMGTASGRAIFALLVLGLRKMEVLSLRWSNVDLECKRLFLPITKSGKSRYAVMNAQAVELFELMLRERSGESDWVFPSSTECGHQRDVRRTFASICKAAEISDFHIHDLRRTHASILINAGVPIMQVRDILGHSDVRTTQIYARIDSSSLEQASEVASDEIKRAFEKAA